LQTKKSFLYTSHKLSEAEIKKIIPDTIATKKKMRNAFKRSERSVKTL
jgi:hypothetical protein